MVSQGNAIDSKVAIFINKGMYAFKKTGPQKIRLAWGQFDFGNGLMLRGNLGVKGCKDLKGKRFGYYPADQRAALRQGAMVRVDGSVLRVRYKGVRN